MVGFGTNRSSGAVRCIFCINCAPEGWDGFSILLLRTLLTPLLSVMLRKHTLEVAEGWAAEKIIVLSSIGYLTGSRVKVPTSLTQFVWQELLLEAAVALKPFSN